MPPGCRGPALGCLTIDPKGVSEMAHGARARQRRRARREAHRRQGLSKATSTVEAVVAGASGSTDLPLSERDVRWDAGAARTSLNADQYGDAHFWRDPEGDPETLAAYKLPFAKNSPPLTAVWRGVTAGAGALSGARGGVDIPDDDVGPVRRR